MFTYHQHRRSGTRIYNSVIIRCLILDHLSHLLSHNITSLHQYFSITAYSKWTLWKSSCISGTGSMGDYGNRACSTWSYGDGMNEMSCRDSDGGDTGDMRYPSSDSENSGNSANDPWSESPDSVRVPVFTASPVLVSSIAKIPVSTAKPRPSWILRYVVLRAQIRNHPCVFS